MKRPDNLQQLSLIEAIISVACSIVLVGLSYFLFAIGGQIGAWALAGTLVVMVYFNSLRRPAHEHT